MERDWERILLVERLIEVIEPALTPVLTQLGEFIVNNLVPPTPLRVDMQMSTGDLIAVKPGVVYFGTEHARVYIGCDHGSPASEGERERGLLLQPVAVSGIGQCDPRSNESWYPSERVVL